MNNMISGDPPQVSTAIRTAIAEIVDQLALRYQDASDPAAWMVAFSGGEDSTLLEESRIAAHRAMWTMVRTEQTSLIPLPFYPARQPRLSRPSRFLWSQ